ncbi:Nlrc3, partial [Symbiodinium sp. CCMP2456]
AFAQNRKLQVMDILLIPKGNSIDVFGHLEEKLRTEIYSLESCGNSGKRLEAIAHTICTSPSLRILNLRENQIGENGGKVLADALQGRTLLQVLDLESNDLRSSVKALAARLPSLPALKTFVLARNSIDDESVQVLAEAITDHSALDLVNLTGNQISQNGMQALAATLGRRTQETGKLKLCLSQNPQGVGRVAAQVFSKSAEILVLDASVVEGSVGVSTSQVWCEVYCVDVGNHLQALATVLESQRRLQILDLSFNLIYDFGVKVLVKSLELSRWLRALYLNNAGITDMGVQVLAPALGKHPHLEMVDLSGNAIGYGIEELAGHVGQERAQAECLKLRLSDPTCPGIGRKAAEALARSGCTVLDILATRSFDSAAFKVLQSGYVLQIHCVGELGSERAEVLARGLAHTPALRVLDLRENTIGPHGGQVLAPALCRLQHLRELGLRHNLLRDLGAQAVAAALAGKTSLEHLDFGLNVIFANGIKALAMALRNLPNLKDLRLDFNEMEFGGQGAQ